MQDSVREVVGYMGFDLHVHTTASDGKFSAEEVIQLAVELGLEGLSITDHDTVNAVNPALEFISRNRLNIELIPGIELNTEAGANEIHILGYYLDHNRKELLLKLQELKRARDERAVKILHRLEELGLPLDLNRVQEHARGEVVGRPHIADAMIEKGYVGTREEAFARYLDYGRPAYISRYKFPPREAIELIKRCGGLAVLAHPGLIDDQAMVAEVIAMGVDGLEVFYPEHSREQTSFYLRLAREKGLLITGGSDFHGPNEGNKLGAARVDRNSITAMQMRLTRR
ncbi:MAG: PHP domain-containing protein [Syntrophomonadaceae bacterium]|nr:PHP domain-containing protein [Syntrophomonadaceae bacterium]